MAIEVLGLSGSPIPNSNTDRAVKKILEASGLESKFIKLSDLDFSPCMACLGCVETNTCTVADDARKLAEEFRKVPAFVLGGYTPYSSLDARTKAFMERMYCLRHRIGSNAGKLGVAVVTTACPADMPGLPPAAQTASGQITTWMMMEGMQHLGTLTVLGNVPCIRCGHGDTCELSGVKGLFGPESSVESVGVNTFEQEPTLLAQAKELGKKLRSAVLEKQ